MYVRICIHMNVCIHANTIFVIIIMISVTVSLILLNRLPNVIKEKLSLHLMLPFLSSCLQNFPLLPHSSMLQKYFPTSPKLRALMSFQDLYIGAFLFCF